MSVVADIDAAPSDLLSALVDDRSLCFEHDSRASFLIDANGMLRHANEAARVMLSAGLLGLDGRRRLVLDAPGLNGVASERSLARSVEVARIYRISPTRWLVATVRRIAGPSALIHVLAREIRLDAEVDLTAVAAEFGLTESERPVLKGLAEAVCPKQISRSLGLSIHTIRSHLRAIYAKLGVHNAAQAQRIILQLYLSVQLIS